MVPQYRPYPHTDAGEGPRLILPELRHRAIENFNAQFKAIIDGHGQVPTKGLVNTQQTPRPSPGVVGGSRTLVRDDSYQERGYS